MSFLELQYRQWNQTRYVNLIKEYSMSINKQQTIDQELIQNIRFI